MSTQVVKETDGSPTRGGVGAIVRIAGIGLAICAVLLTADMLALDYAGGKKWQGPAVLIAFAVFIVQTAMLAGFVGYKLRTHWMWLVFFVWAMVLVNLALVMISLNSSSFYLLFQTAFVYAFLTAQAGLVVFWLLMSSSDWRRRLPFGSAMLLICCYPYWAFIGRVDKWLPVMTCFLVSVALSCLILRTWRFRLSSSSEIETAVKTMSIRFDQFGIKHLFIWTTTVAVLISVGRFVPWSLLAENFLNYGMAKTIGRGLLMTLIFVVTSWTVLGNLRTSGIRLIVFLVFLALIAYVLQWMDQSATAGWSRSTLAGFGLNSDDLLWIWSTWTILNGLFLAGLLLIFRVSGYQLVRMRQIESSGA